MIINNKSLILIFNKIINFKILFIIYKNKQSIKKIFDIKINLQYQILLIIAMNIKFKQFYKKLNNNIF